MAKQKKGCKHGKRVKGRCASRKSKASKVRKLIKLSKSGNQKKK